VWQKIITETGDRNFTVIAVALDTAEAARPWIEAAKPTYPCVIDRHHLVAELYGMTNVPQAVWIDAAGRIVRPTENAGGYDAFRRMNRETRQTPAEEVAKRDAVKAAYVDAVRDWARKGAASRFALDADAVRARLTPVSDNAAEAQVHLRIAQHLLRAGRLDDAATHFSTASRQHPQSWSIWRQGAAKDATGLATGPAFWARVDALGDKPYYPPTDLA
jgi:hypothetical protein